MNVQIILASLRARPVRTAVSVLAVALEVTLILLLVGLTTGIVNETATRPAGVGADIIFMDANSSYFIALNSSVMPIEVGDRIREVEGVSAVAPVHSVTNPGGGFNVVYGIEPESFNAASGGFVFRDGRMFSSPDEAIVDDLYAPDRNVKLGSVITLLNRKFTVTGIVENGKGARIFIPIATAQELTGRDDSASLFYVKVRDRSEVKKVIERMGPGTPFEGNKVIDVNEFASLMTAAASGLMSAFFNVVVFVGVAIGVLVIFLSMYTTITERTREIGILRSLGASRTFIVLLILQETVVLCIAGIAIGMIVSVILSRVIMSLAPTVIVMFTPAWLVRAPIFAILSGLIGSIYPSLKAANKDPVEALAYE